MRSWPTSSRFFTHTRYQSTLDTAFCNKVEADGGLCGHVTAAQQALDRANTRTGKPVQKEAATLRCHITMFDQDVRGTGTRASPATAFECMRHAMCRRRCAHQETASNSSNRRKKTRWYLGYLLVKNVC